MGWKTDCWCGGQPSNGAGSVYARFLKFADLVLQADFVVVDYLAVESIIGLDFLESQGCVIDLHNKLLQVGGLSIPLEHGQDTFDSQQIAAEVAVVETLSIPPFSEIQTMASCNPVIDHRTWLIEGSRADLPVMIAGALVTSTPTGQGGYVPILIVNPLPTDVTIYKGTRVATASPLETMMVAPVGEVPNNSSNVHHACVIAEEHHAAGNGGINCMSLQMQ